MQGGLGGLDPQKKAKGSGRDLVHLHPPGATDGHADLRKSIRPGKAAESFGEKLRIFLDCDSVKNQAWKNSAYSSYSFCICLNWLESL